MASPKLSLFFWPPQCLLAEVWWDCDYLTPGLMSSCNPCIRGLEKLKRLDLTLINHHGTLRTYINAYTVSVVFLYSLVNVGGSKQDPFQLVIKQWVNILTIFTLSFCNDTTCAPTYCTVDSTKNPCVSLWLFKGL